MEFAAAALASLAEAGAAAGTAVAAAGETAAAAGTAVSAYLPAASTVTSILSGTATVASVLMAQRAGEEKARMYGLAAEDAQTDAQLEQVNNVEARRSLKAALVKAVGERDVAAAASGVDLSFGTPVSARQQAMKEGEQALALEDESSALRRSRLLERAASYRQAAEEARAGGLGKAAALALEGGAKITRRG